MPRRCRLPTRRRVGFPDTEFLQATAEARQGARRQAACDLPQPHARMRASSFEWRSLESFSGDSALSRHCQRALRRPGRSRRSANPHAVDRHAPMSTRCSTKPAGRCWWCRMRARPMTAPTSASCIAWNGSREAARAAFDALPLLIEAETHRDPRHRSAGRCRGRRRGRRRRDRRRAGPPWRQRQRVASETSRGRVDRRRSFRRASPTPAPTFSCSAPTAIPGCANCCSAA